MMSMVSVRWFGVLALAGMLMGASASCTATTDSGPTVEPELDAAEAEATVEPDTAEAEATDEPDTVEVASTRPMTIPAWVERPGAHNTGPVDVEALEPVNEKITIETPGTVLENVDVQGKIDIKASNVTVRNFRVDAGMSHYGVHVRKGLSDVVVEDGEVTNSASAGVYCQSACTLRRLHIHDHAADGMKISGDNGPSLVEHTFVTRLGMGEGAHADGDQSVTASDLTFRYNNFFMPKPGTEAHDAMPRPDGVTKFSSNSAFIIHDDTDDVLIENNWLNGGNYTIYGYHGTVVRNNIFGPDYKYGICNGPFDEWSGNVMEDGTPLGEDDSCT